jgi:hypothetical protein
LHVVKSGEKREREKGKKKTRLSPEGGSGVERGVNVGNDLLSHAATRILPSVLVDLTAGFEMGPGVPPPLKSPTNTPRTSKTS